MNILERLHNYPGAHPGEDWKNDTDLNHCTDREKEQMRREGLTMKDLKGLNRGQVHHILFGWRHTK